MFLMDLMDATANQGSTGNTCTMYHARSPPITGSRPRRRVRNLGLLQGCYVDAPPVVVWRARKVDDRPSRQSRGQASLRYGFSRFVVCCCCGWHWWGWIKTRLGSKSSRNWLIGLERVFAKIRAWCPFHRTPQTPVTGGFKWQNAKLQEPGAQIPEETFRWCASGLQTEWKKCNLRLWCGRKKTRIQSVPNRWSHMAASGMRSRG